MRALSASFVFSILGQYCMLAQAGALSLPAGPGVATNAVSAVTVADIFATSGEGVVAATAQCDASKVPQIANLDDQQASPCVKSSDGNDILDTLLGKTGLALPGLDALATLPRLPDAFEAGSNRNSLIARHIRIQV